MRTTTKPARRTRPAIAARARHMRILVATAGEPDSDGALRVAGELSRLRGAEVLAVGVSTPFPHNVGLMASLKQPVALDEEARQSVLTDMRRQLTRIPDSAKWAKRAVIGWPVETINDFANSWHASLIVLGIGRHRRIDRLFGTETAIHVMRHAKHPVLAVAARALGLPTRAIVALDFTPASLAAAELAARLLAPGGTMYAAHASSFGGMPAHAGDLVDLYRSGAAAKMTDAVKFLRRRTRRQIEPLMLEGEPGEAIITAARRNRCDLVALGGHEQGLMDRILIGSVRTRVLRSVTCSVLIAGANAIP